jgi:hypothetical protein
VPQGEGGGSAEREGGVIEESSVIPVTTTDAQGRVTGARLANGEWVEAAPVQKTQFWWDDPTARFYLSPVVWCGASVKHAWSSTRGELLGDYSQVPPKSLADVAGKLRVKVATWALRRIDEGEPLDVKVKMPRVIDEEAPKRRARG